MKQNAGLAKYLFKKWTKNSKSLYLPEKAKVIWEQSEKQPECYKRNHRKNQRKNDAFQKCFYIDQSEMNNEWNEKTGRTCCEYWLQICINKLQSEHHFWDALCTYLSKS